MAELPSSGHEVQDLVFPGDAPSFDDCAADLTKVLDRGAEPEVFELALGLLQGMRRPLDQRDPPQEPPVFDPENEHDVRLLGVSKYLKRDNNDSTLVAGLARRMANADTEICETLGLDKSQPTTKFSAPMITSEGVAHWIVYAAPPHQQFMNTEVRSGGVNIISGEDEHLQEPYVDPEYSPRLVFSYRWGNRYKGLPFVPDFIQSEEAHQEEGIPVSLSRVLHIRDGEQSI